MPTTAPRIPRSQTSALRFLLPEGKKESDVCQAAPGVSYGGTHIQCTLLSRAPGFFRPCGSHTGAQAPRGGKGSVVSPCPSSPPRKAAQAQLRGQRQRGGCRGEGHRGGMWEAGRGNSRGQQAAKKSSGPAISPCSSVLPGPRRPPPARRCALGELSSLVPGAAAGWARLRRCSAAGSSLGLENRVGGWVRLQRGGWAAGVPGPGGTTSGAALTGLARICLLACKPGFADRM